MGFVEVNEMKEIDVMRIYAIIGHVKRCGSFDYCVSELERLGLQRICGIYNIDYDWLNEAEKEELWKELLEMAREIEFKKYYEDIYDCDD